MVAILPGHRVAVVGAGTVGCLVAWLVSRIPLCEVELVDTNPARAAVAARWASVSRAPHGASGEADVVMHASGTGAGLATALGLAGMEATVVDLSWYGDQTVALPLGGAFHSRRLTIVLAGGPGRAQHSARAGHMAPAPGRRAALARRPRARRADDRRDARSSICRTRCRRCHAPAGDVICHSVTYD